MPYESLRDYLSVLESHGLIQWVEKEVDKDWEISSLARQYFRKTSSTNRTALGFRKVKNYESPVVLGSDRWVSGESMDWRSRPGSDPRRSFKPGNGALKIPWSPSW